MSPLYSAKIEALLFVAGKNGVPLKELASLLQVDASACLQQLEKMKENYDTDKTKGITILEVGDVYKLVTKSSMKKILENYSTAPNTPKLSQAAIETLAIIAYRQPLSRSDIDEIRGVQSHGALQSLILKHLIEEKGRFEGTGRAILYGTTKYFLDYFGLKTLEELPKIEELEEDNEEIPDLFAVHENLEEKGEL